ncbi:MAG: molecular chaperone GrpE [Oleiphilaceae bacterium]|jgi:molecular chaperone GrpE
MEAHVSVEDEKLKGDEAELNGVNSAEQNIEEGVLEAEVISDVDETVDQKDWKAEAEALAQQIEGLKDQTIRAQADAQNIRRRAEQDVEKAHKFALEKFAKELLPIVDGLEKAVEAEVASGNEMTTLREGVEMTLSMFLSGVKKFKLEQIDPVGHPFDPALHEAMTMVEAPDAEPNTVIAAMQKGYTLSGRLIRPAMVVVSKGASKVDEQA